MSEHLVSPKDLRQAVRKLGALLLQSRSNTLPIAGVREGLGVDVSVPPAWEQKGDRFGHANAITGLLRKHMVEGRGPAARFKDAPPNPPGRQPATLLRNGIRLVFVAAARDFNSQTDRSTELMERYSELSEGLPPARRHIRLGQGILFGADYSQSIDEWTNGLALLMNGHTSFAGVPAALRRDAAHNILIFGIGRDASMHGEDFPGVTPTDELCRNGEASLRDTRTGYRIDLGSDRRAAALRQGEESHDTPVLGCPAHQLREGEPETDLETFVHAGINYAYDLGVFGPVLTLPQ